MIGSDNLSNESRQIGIVLATCFEFTSVKKSEKIKVQRGESDVKNEGEILL